MPKKGEKLPYRVRYQFPGRPEYSIALRSYPAAEAEAGAIAKHGAAVTVYGVLGEGGVVALAMFGPDVTHWYRLPLPYETRIALICDCGYLAVTDDDITTHMMHAEACWECWGTGFVRKGVNDDQGRPVAGDAIDCPPCQGTGRADDVNFRDIDRTAYLNARQVLELIS